MIQLAKTPACRVGRTPRLAATARRRARSARVIVAWSPANEAGLIGAAPTEIELEAELETSTSTTWTCRQAPESGWVEALSSARCREVVLTAELGDDVPAKHLVLALAELLTFKLAATQPLIRVRFLPPSTEGRSSRRSA